MKKTILTLVLIGFSFGIKAQHNYDNQNTIYSKNGNVSIGTTDAKGFKLGVKGGVRIENGNTDLLLYRDNDVGDWSLLRTNTGNGIGLIGQPDVIALSVSRATSNVGIGTTDTKGFKLGVKGGVRIENGNTDLLLYRDNDVGDWSLLRTNTGNGIGLIGQPDVVALSVSRTTSNVGIGTTDTKGFKLGVKGKIAAEEVKVALHSQWPDFVFETNYNLPTLIEVENHIKEKGHLKDIPSAKEVEKNGVYLGAMDAKLLQKIEELTLYTIQQEKEIKKLKSLNTKLQELNLRLEKLESQR
ncbi:hypothetical protein IWQ47_004958 [Aquimarina sp. EL_43]|uniref:hypothetical protein n=1 Tax=unclassified Aquimarina TaxID=2627091 RepID=UPI0018CBCE58|nr:MULTISPECIES: hypothetical protein [unclassified Aquimarina]MBG6133546.1 hypothetical protein [Aquimarina sp. EL_35]MBG6153661.1 hypothetical protein [Aquimarina sp. EL_32]MBG6171860.1 hypothetical protein [Aquimarina sp. EL_43]